MNQHTEKETFEPNLCWECKQKIVVTNDTNFSQVQMKIEDKGNS